MVGIVVIDSLFAPESHVDNSDWRIDEIRMCCDPVQAGDQVFVGSDGSLIRIGLKNAHAINRGVWRHTNDVDRIVSRRDDTGYVGSVTVEILAGTANGVEGI